MKTLGQLMSALLLGAAAAGLGASAWAQFPPAPGAPPAPGGAPAPGGTPAPHVAPGGAPAPRPGPVPRANQGYRDHDPWHFTEHDWGVWRGGNWNHAWHDGRLGWWWVVGSYWYFYAQPVYPYPDPYLPPAVVVQPGPSGPAPAQYWYYCDNPPGYYPYVTSCSTAWRQVPVTPQGQTQ
jgi:hypothetical protein